MPRYTDDLRFSLRTLRKNPGMAFAAIATLALGSGVNTAVFSVTSALLLKPFAYRDPARLVLIEVKRKDSNGEIDNDFSLGRYELVRDHNRSFSGVAAAANDTADFTGRGEPLEVPIARVSPNFFSVLGVNPQLGRVFRDDEGKPGGAPVVMISDSLWRSRFGGDGRIVGQTVNVDAEPQSVIGVLPAGVKFPFLGPAEVWSPRYYELSIVSPQNIRNGVGYLTAVARLAPGASMGAAASEMGVLNSRYTQENPKAPDGGPNVWMAAEDLRSRTVAGIRTGLLLLSAAVGVILLISCANVANLLLSHSLTRRKELAIRAALGAGSGAIVRQLLTESLLLTSVGGVIGLVLSWAATRYLVASGAGILPPGFPIEMDWRVFLFTIAISAFAAVAVGLSPALQLSRTDVRSALSEEGRGAAHGSNPGRNRKHLASLLVVAQIALSMVLLVGTGLLVRSFALLVRVQPGFDSTNVLTANVSLPKLKYATGPAMIGFFDLLMRRLAVVPGVSSAAMSATLPLTHIRISPILVEGQPVLPLAERPFTIIEAISPRFFDVMRIPVIAGRTFTDADTNESPHVVIVNAALAHRYWPGQNPVGRHISVGRQTIAEIAGVASNATNSGLTLDTEPQVYIPFPQLFWGNMNILVRTTVDPHSLFSAVRKEVAALDPDLPVTKLQTVGDIMDEARAQPRFTMFLLGIFSVVALVLAVVGVHGVLACSVAQRRFELGIRLALGGNKGQILRMVVGQGLALAIGGILLGVSGALAVTHVMASVLYKTAPRDLVTFVAAPVLFLIVCLLASYVPARRAAETDPADVLRQA
jgi:putative ABC transport system permease protein